VSTGALLGWVAASLALLQAKAPARLALLIKKQVLKILKLPQPPNPPALRTCGAFWLASKRIMGKARFWERIAFLGPIRGPATRTGTRQQANRAFALHQPTYRQTRLKTHV
jgi:hypothetical protein